tara:strand:- start:98 stop:1744 length:1647 start_codon:yes stop_codon:yes gene_type:complete
VFTLFFQFQCFSLSNLKDKPEKWQAPKSKLIHIFLVKKEQKKIKLIRLYNDLQYEFLHYDYDRRDRAVVHIAKGKYSLKNSILKLKCDHIEGTKGRVAHNDWYFFKKDFGLTTNIFRYLFKKKSIEIREVDDSRYKMPFYVCPKNQVVVYNKKSSVRIDLTDLANGLAAPFDTETERAASIMNFVKNTLSYKQLGRHLSSEELVAGKNRKGVCADYARLTNELLNLVGIQSEYVIGAAKNSYNDILLNAVTNHAWNIVTIDNVKQIHDVTWADGAGDQWLNINPKIAIYTHFPDKKNHQLLNNTMTKKEFHRSPIVNPEDGQKRFQDLNLNNGIVYIDSVFEFEIPNDTFAITCTRIDDFKGKVIYNRSTSYSNASIISSTRIVKRGNVFFYRIPLSDKMNLLTIRTPSAEFQVLILRGNQLTLLEHYLNTADTKNEDPFVRGLITSIKLNDLGKLKALVGDTNSLFFDQKGELSLPKALIEQIDVWDGRLNLLTCNTLYEHNDSTKPKITETNYIDFNNYRFILGKAEGRMRIEGLIMVEELAINER